MLSEKNMLNEAETYVAKWLTADPDVTAVKIHEKFVQKWQVYKQFELPAIAITCNNIVVEDEKYLINGVMEIVALGAMEVADTNAKKVVAEVIVSLNKDFVPGYNKSGEFQIIGSSNAQVNPIPMADNRYFGIGYVEFSLEVIRR